MSDLQNVVLAYNPDLEELVALLKVAETSKENSFEEIGTIPLYKTKSKTVEKLPTALPYMKIGEATLLEALGLMVQAGIVTESDAFQCYETAKKKYPGWDIPR